MSSLFPIKVSRTLAQLLLQDAEAAFHCSVFCVGGWRQRVSVALALCGQKFLLTLWSPLNRPLSHGILS